VKSKLALIKNNLKQYKGILVFALVLAVSNLIWKFIIQGDESMSIQSKITCWGADVSAPFNFAAVHIAQLVKSVLNALGWQISIDASNTIRHVNGHGTQIIWACTGIKQAYIFICIMFFSQGEWKRKMVYILFGLICVYCFNLFRISFIMVCVEHHKDWFSILHEYIFKYLFYAFIFLMWMVWEENVGGVREKKYE